MLDLLMRMTSEPWMLADDSYRALVSLAARAAAGEDVKLSAAAIGLRPMAVIGEAAGAPGAEFQLVGSVGVVPIWGVLDKTDPRDWEGYRIGTGYDRIERTLAAAQADDRVKSVVLAIDSPGGAARYIESPAAAIGRATAAGRGGGKPVVAVANDLMASAALYLGVQADKVHAMPTSWIGSIGTRLEVVNITGLLDKWGIKVESIKSGKYKDLGSPFRPMSDDDRAKLQEGVNQYFGLFKSAVQRGRGMDAERVAALATGEGFIGAQAVAAGLADSVVTSLADVIAQLNGTTGAGSSGSSRGPRAATDGGTAAGSSSMDPKDVKDKAGGTTGTEKTEAQTDKAPETKAPETQDIAGAVSQAMARQHQRITGIESVCRPYAHVAGIEKIRQDALVDQTATVESVSAKVLAALTASQTPVGSIDLSLGSEGAERERADMESAVIARMRPDLCDALAAGDERAHRIARSLGADDPKALAATMRRGRDAMSRRRLIDMAETCAVRAETRLGRPRPNFTTHDQVLAAAYGHGSSDFPHLTSNVANKVLLTYFGEQQTRYQRFAAIGSSTDFKATDLVTLSGLNSLVLTPEGAPLKEATINERKEAIRVYTYGRKFSITREAMVNDDLGGIQRTLQTWGIVAARTPELLATQVLTSNPTMADGFALFSTEHNNLGGATALSAAALEAAVTKMKRQKSFGKDTPYLDIQPKTLLVPSELWGAANRITKSVIDPTAGNTNSNVPNVIRELGLDPLDTPHIATATNWFLLGDPSLQPVVQVNFLQGRREPIVTPVGNGSIRGQEFEIIFDCGAKAVGHEAGVFYAGA